MSEKPKEPKSIVYAMYANYIQGIKHFDTMQTYYRMMASTFLLASFAAIGFLFSYQNKNIVDQSLASLILICIFGLASILSLWHLDLIFCERLLIANFAEALKLEIKHDWLPGVHKNIRTVVYKREKHANVVIFYFGSGSCLILTTGIICSHLLFNHSIEIRVGAVIATLAAVALLYWYLKTRTRKVKDLLAGLGV